jgi:aminoglycoside phosphotransferase (APT) family kinase protein
MPGVTLRSDEIVVDEVLVQALISDQLPDHASDGVRRVSLSGSSNALFRLGDELVVRLPRQPGGSASLLKEARWLPYLHDALPVEVPEIVAVGEPGHGYPEHWSVLRWIAGVQPSMGTSTQLTQEHLAHDLADVLRALRDLEVPPTGRDDAALHWYRAGPLAAIDADIRDYAEQCRDMPGLDLDIDAVVRLWDEAMAVADGPSPGPHWLHGDLLAESLLIRDGRLAAILDFGGLAVGDPTVDLVAAWDLLDPNGRAVLRAQAGLDDRAWLLGRAWALAIAVMTFPYYWHTMPQRCTSRLALAHQVLSDASR